MIADSRPRVTYLLPEGTPIKIIFDHGEVAPATTTFQRASGGLVTVTKAPIATVPSELERARKLLTEVERSVGSSGCARIAEEAESGDEDPADPGYLLCDDEVRDGTDHRCWEHMFRTIRAFLAVAQ